MTVSPALAERIIAGAKAGRLLLLLTEVADMLDNVPPDLTVITPSGAVRVMELPVTVMDPYDPHPDLHLDDERNRLEEWRDQLVASVAEDLIDADDAERLWHHPPT